MPLWYFSFCFVLVSGAVALTLKIRTAINFAFPVCRLPILVTAHSVCLLLR